MHSDHGYELAEIGPSQDEQKPDPPMEKPYEPERVLPVLPPVGGRAWS